MRVCKYLNVFQDYNYFHEILRLLHNQINFFFCVCLQATHLFVPARSCLEGVHGDSSF